MFFYFSASQNEALLKSYPDILKFDTRFSATDAVQKSISVSIAVLVCGRPGDGGGPGAGLQWSSTVSRLQSPAAATHNLNQRGRPRNVLREISII